MLCGCGTVLLKPHAMQVKLVHFGQKKVEYHLTVAITIHSYGPLMPPAHKPHHTVTFLDALVAFAILLVDIHSTIDNSAYLDTH